MSYRDTLRAAGLDFATREQWGAQSYANRPSASVPWRYWFLHISVTQDPNDLVGTEHRIMRTLEDIGNSRFGSGISYTWAVFDTGRVYEGHPIDKKGAHTVNDRGISGYPFNLNYYGRAIVLPQICRDEVTDEQVLSIARVVSTHYKAGFAKSTKLLPHSFFAEKDCPCARARARIPDMHDAIADFLRGKRPIEPAPKPIPERKDFDMFLLKIENETKAYITDGLRKRHIPSLGEWKKWRRAGLPLITLTKTEADSIPTDREV